MTGCGAVGLRVIEPPASLVAWTERMSVEVRTRVFGPGTMLVVLGPPGSWPVGNHPATSAIRCVPLCVYRFPAPSGPRGTTARLATVWPARSAFNLDAVGRGPPDGPTVTSPGPSASVAVT